MERTVSLHVAPGVVRWPLGAGVAVFALALVASAYVRVPLPFTPVPLTLQDAVVLLAGAVLGLRGGVAATVVYLCAGAAGLPVYSGGGAGLAHLAGPTGGYLLGFVAAAAMVGAMGLAGRRFFVVALGLAAAEALVHLFGVVYLSRVLGSGLGTAFALGSQPFLPITVAKIGLVATIVSAYGRPLADRFLGSSSDTND
jgi:biotin transport system substrate-specific component